MKYQSCNALVQAAAARPDAATTAVRSHSDANINPQTGLASDYLNHFNEAIMLLDMLPGFPDCRAEFLEWQPMSYRAHFAASRFNGRDLAIAAYETADPAVRSRLDGLAAAMTAMLEAMRAVMLSDLPPEAVGELAVRAAAALKPLVARAGAVINGADPDLPQAPQAAADGLMMR
jgi:hypothetical protein